METLEKNTKLNARETKCQSGLFSKSGAVSGRANGNSLLLQRCPKIGVFNHLCCLLHIIYIVHTNTVVY